MADLWRRATLDRRDMPARPSAEQPAAGCSHRLLTSPEALVERQLRGEAPLRHSQRVERRREALGSALRPASGAEDPGSGQRGHRRGPATALWDYGGTMGPRPGPTAAMPATRSRGTGTTATTAAASVAHGPQMSSSARPMQSMRLWRGTGGGGWLAQSTPPARLQQGKQQRHVPASPRGGGGEGRGGGEAGGRAVYSGRRAGSHVPSNLSSY